MLEKCILCFEYFTQKTNVSTHVLASRLILPNVSTHVLASRLILPNFVMQILFGVHVLLYC